MRKSRRRGGAKVVAWIVVALHIARPITNVIDSIVHLQSGKQKNASKGLFFYTKVNLDAHDQSNNLQGVQPIVVEIKRERQQPS
jgi:hypothetical protein